MGDDEPVYDYDQIWSFYYDALICLPGESPGDHEARIVRARSRRDERLVRWASQRWGD